MVARRLAFGTSKAQRHLRTDVCLQHRCVWQSHPTVRHAQSCFTRCHPPSGEVRGFPYWELVRWGLLVKYTAWSVNRSAAPQHEGRPLGVAFSFGLTFGHEQSSARVAVTENTVCGCGQLQTFSGNRTRSKQRDRGDRFERRDTNPAGHRPLELGLSSWARRLLHLGAPASPTYSCDSHGGQGIGVSDDNVQ